MSLATLTSELPRNLWIRQADADRLDRPPLIVLLASDGHTMMATLGAQITSLGWCLIMFYLKVKWKCEEVDISVHLDLPRH